MIELLDVMSPEDRSTFNFDVRALDWNAYLHAYVVGVRRFIFKENADTIPVARRYQSMFYWIRTALHLFLLYLVYHILRYFFLT